MNAFETIDVRPMSGQCGAEVLGIDLGGQIGNRQWDEVRRAFADYGVIFFRDQKLTPEQHIAFARRFGPIDINRFFQAVPDYPEIAEVRKEPEQKTNIGGGWHTDHSYDAAPAMGSVLLARDIPPSGGDTLFASMYAAWDALSEGLRKTLDGMRAVHSAAHVFGEKGGYKGREAAPQFKNADLAVGEVSHPVGIVHPESGRRALYVNPAFTTRFEGWTAAESKPLLDYLYAHAARPEFTCRFRWAEGSVAFWDNRATWHYALNDYQGDRRVMHRITIAGQTLG